MTEQKEIGIVKNVDEFGLIIKDINFGVQVFNLWGLHWFIS